MFNQFDMEQFQVIPVNGLNVLCIWAGKQITESGWKAVNILQVAV